MARRTARQGFLAFISEVFFLIFIVVLIRTLVFGLYQVPTGSMETTMLVGERFFADKFTYLFRDPRNSEIISFNEPLFPYSKNPLVLFWQEYFWGPYFGSPEWHGPANWTKRVIGTPGQTVRGVIEEGKPVVYVDDKKLDEPYLNKYPLILVNTKSPDTLFDEFKKRAEQEVLEGRLPVSQFLTSIKDQVRSSARQKSYDPSKAFDDQSFYDIDPKRVVRDKDGEPILSYPGTPSSIPDKEHVRFPSAEDRKMTCRNWNGTDEFCVTLKEDEFWVMGDNRKGSHDSRFFGPIKRRLIHGRILFRIWSNDSDKEWWIFDLLFHPIKFLKQMRWNRFFQIVK